MMGLFGDSGASAFFVEETAVPDFEQLYHIMVNAAEDAIAAPDAGKPADAKQLLISAEQKAEDIYLETDPI